MNRAQARFTHQFIDIAPGYDGWGASVAADFDNDGRPEFATGGKGGGFYFLYDFDPALNQWTRRVITHEISPQVGCAAADLDGDGRLELVCGSWGENAGTLFWLVPRGSPDDPWECIPVASGLTDPHDVLAGDIDGDGLTEVIVRNKNGAMVLYRPGRDPRRTPWESHIIAGHLEGDGTALVPSESGCGLDIVTNQGWFANISGDARTFERRSLIPQSLGWHPESRLVVGDFDGTGQPVVVITESEISPARMAILRQNRSTGLWGAQMVIDRIDGVCALHSLQLVDMDGDGELEIFTAEMENGKSDGVVHRPRWWIVDRDGSTCSRTCMLDQNLGAHGAIAADYDGDGQIEVVGKVWRPNKVNGCDGRNHVDWLRPLAER